MIEIWLPYPDNAHYEVSDQGRVRRASTGHVMKPSPVGAGYLYLTLRAGVPNPGMQRYIHRMVWETFHGPIPEGMQVRHGINGRLDNRLSQLKIGTPAENAQDRIDHARERVANARKPCNH